MLITRDNRTFGYRMGAVVEKGLLDLPVPMPVRGFSYRHCVTLFCIVLNRTSYFLNCWFFFSLNQIFFLPLFFISSTPQ